MANGFTKTPAESEVRQCSCLVSAVFTLKVKIRSRRHVRVLKYFYRLALVSKRKSVPDSYPVVIYLIFG